MRQVGGLFFRCISRTKGDKRRQGTVCVETSHVLFIHFIEAYQSEYTILSFFLQPI